MSECHHPHRHRRPHRLALHRARARHGHQRPRSRCGRLHGAGGGPGHRSRRRAPWCSPPWHGPSVAASSSARWCAFPLALVCYGLAPSLWSSAPAILVVGACYIGVLTGLNTVVQRRAPTAARGRVLGLYMMVLGVVYPVGAVLEGAIAHVVGIRAVTVVSGVTLFAAMAAIGLWRGQLFTDLERSRHAVHRRDLRRRGQRRPGVLGSDRSALAVTGHPAGVETVEPGPAEDAQRRVAGALDQQGVGPGDRVVFCLPSSARPPFVCPGRGPPGGGPGPAQCHAAPGRARRAHRRCRAGPRRDRARRVDAPALGPGGRSGAVSPGASDALHLGHDRAAPRGCGRVCSTTPRRGPCSRTRRTCGGSATPTPISCVPRCTTPSLSALPAAALLRGGRVVVLPRFDAAAAVAALETISSRRPPSWLRQRCNASWRESGGPRHLRPVAPSGACRIAVSRRR